MSQTFKMNLPATTPLPWDEGSILFVGTATTVIRLGGYTILTDPNFLHAGEHVHLGYGLLAKRLTDPAIDIDELPEIDFCILSHMHGDHWDHVATEQLRKSLPIITTHGAMQRLKLHGFNNAVALKKWQSIEIHKAGAPPIKVTAMPGKHGPGIMNFMLPQVMGSLIEVGEPKAFRLYISGDTLVHRELHEIPRHYRNIDLMLMHLGGTKALGLLVTMDAEQGIQALRIIKPEEAIPIHYNDYDRFKSPLEDFMRLVERTNLSTKVSYLYHGNIHRFSIPALSQREIA